MKTIENKEIKKNQNPLSNTSFPCSPFFSIVDVDVAPISYSEQNWKKNHIDEMILLRLLEELFQA